MEIEITGTGQSSKDEAFCEKCHLVLPSFTDLGKHLELVHGYSKDFECSVCSFVAPTNKLLQQHLINHAKGVKFQCEICYQLCKSKSNLLRHIRYKHTHEKPYKCPHCPFAAVEKHKLEDHMAGHNVETLFFCKLCNKSFQKKSGLRTHERKHATRKKSGVRFICILCCGLFVFEINLRHHLHLVHHVENVHMLGLQSSEKDGLPAILSTYLDRLDVSKEVVLKGGILKYMEIKSEYSEDYAKHFRNVSDVISVMQMKKDGGEKFDAEGEKPPRYLLDKLIEGNVIRKRMVYPRWLVDRRCKQNTPNEKEIVKSSTKDEQELAIQNIVPEKQNQSEFQLHKVDSAPKKSLSENCTRLVPETEDKLKRMSLLSRMKMGDFGPKPCVIKVLPDGSIMDCTHDYQNYLPS